MARFVWTNTRLYASGVDLTSNMNKIEITAESEEKETTSFGDNGWKTVLAGLRSTEVTAEGQWEAGDESKVDDASWAGLGSVDAWSVVPDSQSPAAGDLAYLTKALRAEYKIGDAVGEVAPWQAKATGSSPLVRGSVAHPPGTARSVSGDGTGVNLGALSATQRLHVNLHVLSVAGTATPSITVRIESDVDNTFGSPVTVHTFSAATAIGGQSATISGPITDSWFRPAWTVSGTSPSFLFLVTWGVA